MKIRNKPLVGRKEAPLMIIDEDGESKDITLGQALESACYLRANEESQKGILELQTSRKINKVLDAIEEAGCCFEIPEEDLDIVKPSLEEVLLRSWPLHAPIIMDNFDATYQCDCTGSGDCCDSGD